MTWNELFNKIPPYQLNQEIECDIILTIFYKDDEIECFPQFDDIGFEIINDKPLLKIYANDDVDTVDEILDSMRDIDTHEEYDECDDELD